jgi:hypothetical protein
MTIAVIRLVLIPVLSAYAINQPRSLFLIQKPRIGAAETRRAPFGSSMFHHIIDKEGVSIVSVGATQSSRAGLGPAKNGGNLRKRGLVYGKPRLNFRR